jgi:predicted NBD/HSP70 family sugar kinase
MPRAKGIYPVEGLNVPEFLKGKRVVFESGGSGVRAVTMIDGALQTGSIRRINPKSWKDWVEWTRAVKDMEAPFDKTHITAAGVFLKDGTVVESPNRPEAKGHNLLELFDTFCNDLIGAVLGECYCEKGLIRFIKNGVFQTNGGGWGGVSIREGVIYRGEPGHKYAGDQYKDVKCGCGRKGCLEGVYSGGAIKKRVLKIAKDAGVGVDENGDINGSDPCAWLDYCAGCGQEWAVNLYEWIATGIGHAWADVLNDTEAIEIIGYMGTFAVYGMKFMKDTILRVMLEQSMFPIHQEAIRQQIETGEEIILVGSKLWSKECPINSFTGAALYGGLTEKGLI